MDKAADALNRLGVRLESWRSEYSAPTPIPADIWKRASELAGLLGVARVAKALRLDYSRLKKLSSGDSATPPEPPSVERSSFVELRSFLPETAGRCVIEIESPRGARMRLQMDSAQSSSLVALVREFVGG